MKSIEIQNSDIYKDSIPDLKGKVIDKVILEGELEGDHYKIRVYFDDGSRFSMWPFFEPVKKDGHGTNYMRYEVDPIFEPAEA